MQKLSYTDKFKYWLLKVLQLQLFISTISLPILMFWGLPISMASPIGNILFTPILSIFLFLSSLIFFCEIICIPNQIIINLLDWFTKAWMSLLNLGSANWLITFPVISNFFLIVVPILSLAILQNKKTNNLKRSIICFSVILLGTWLCTKLYNKPENSVNTFVLDNKKITIINKDQKISIIDHGQFSRSNSINTYIEYTLMPYLIKNFGHANLENLVTNLNKRTINMAKFLLNKITIRNIHFLNNKNMLIEQDLTELQEYAGKRNVSIKLLNNQSIEKVICQIKA